MPKIKTLAVIFVTLTILLAIKGPTTHAEMAKGISVALPNIAEDVKVGSIVSYDGNNYVMSKESYDTEIFGVVVEESSIGLTDPTSTQSKLVIHSGEAQVLVLNSNGEIKKGDYITSSTTPGVGQKADKSGYVLGKAMEDFVPGDSSTPGLVWTVIEPKNTFRGLNMQTNLLDALRSGSVSPIMSPVESLRYLLAAIIVAATFIIGFSTFGRSSGRTIEALGRNPLAQGSIKTAMVFNMVLAFGVMLIGLALAYLILVL